jgi:hypothetical protein
MRLALLLASIALAVPAISVAAPKAAARPAADYNARLARLFHESDEAQLRLNPLNAMFRGVTATMSLISTVRSAGFARAWLPASCSPG